MREEFQRLTLTTLTTLIFTSNGEGSRCVRVGGGKNGTLTTLTEEEAMGEEVEMVCWLRGWKRIASYCDCSVRTAQRMAKSKGLPVHRTDGGPVAIPCDLDAWLKKQTMDLA